MVGRLRFVPANSRLTMGIDELLALGGTAGARPRSVRAADLDDQRVRRCRQLSRLLREREEKSAHGQLVQPQLAQLSSEGLALETPPTRRKDKRDRDVTASPVAWNSTATALSAR
jgi:hypothetical protein